MPAERTPVAPWALRGESLVGLVAGRRQGGLPWGLEPIPGPSLVVALCYTGSPVGTYLELVVGQPARLGMRPGWCITTMVVDSPESRRGGQLNWGFPKEVGHLVWSSDGPDRELRWADRDIVVRGRVGRVPLPFLVPVRTLQRRGDGPVVVPGRLRGRASPTWVDVEAPAGDPLGTLAGHHPGLHVAGLRLVIHPARQPVGLASSLRAPLRAPEPAPLLVSNATIGAPGRLAQR